MRTNLYEYKIFCNTGVSMLLVWLSILQSKATGKEMAKTAVVNLVDLAGSERVDSTGATGDRLKEVSKR